MGSSVSVTCPRCHYHVESLSGLGGQFGMSGRVILTVVCPRKQALVDVRTPLNVAHGDSVPALDGRWPPSEPCERCRATDHRPWDAEAAVCPACGHAGCDIQPDALWD